MSRIDRVKRTLGLASPEPAASEPGGPADHTAAVRDAVNSGDMEKVWSALRDLFEDRAYRGALGFMEIFYVADVISQARVSEVQAELDRRLEKPKPHLPPKPVGDGSFGGFTSRAK